jgi:hypothetical protein
MAEDYRVFAASKKNFEIQSPRQKRLSLRSFLEADDFGPCRSSPGGYSGENPSFQRDCRRAFDLAPLVDAHSTNLETNCFVRMSEMSKSTLANWHNEDRRPFTEQRFGTIFGSPT